MRTYYFNNKHNIETIKEDINYLIENNDNDCIDIFGENISRNYSEETINVMKKTSEHLKQSFELVDELDKLLSETTQEKTYVETTKNLLD